MTSVAHVEIPLTKGYVALIDADDYEVVSAFRWHAQCAGRNVYASRKLRRSEAPEAPPGTSIGMHRFLTGWAEVDHHNGHGLDNRRINLRQVTHRQNLANLRLARNNTSGFKGVTWNKRLRRWCAQIRAGQAKGLGVFDTAEAAALAYDAAARKLFGEFAALNFPLPGERSAHPNPKDSQ